MYIIVDLVCSPLSVKYGDIEMTAIIVIIIIIIIRSFPLHILVASDSVFILLKLFLIYVLTCPRKGSTPSASETRCPSIKNCRNSTGVINECLD